MHTGNGNNPGGIAKHVVEGGVPTGEYQIASAAMGKSWQSAGRTENEIERTTIILVECLQESALIFHLRLNQLPVVQSVTMTEVAYRLCKPLLPQQAKQPT